MGSVQNFYTSRDNKTDPATYVGQLDRLWYNPVTNSIFVSDGTTPGGQPVALATGANIVADNIALNSITARTSNVTLDGNLILNGWAEIAGNISPAATNKIGGIAPGPGVIISNQGILTIDSANLPVSFGNFTANNNVLSIVNVNEDMILQTEGDAEIQLVGNIGFYKPDGIPPNISNRYAFFNKDGQATFYVPVADPVAGAFKIVGSQSGNFSSPVNTGVMLQITGQNNDASRLYNDSIGSFSAFVGRRINGLVGSPTAVQAGDEIIRISSTGYDGTEIPGSGTARIVFQAMENYTPTAKGSNLSLWATAISSNVLTKIATVDVANGFNATKFTTSGTVSATGNITGGNILTSGTINSTGTISATGNVSGGNLVTVGTVSATGNIATNSFIIGNGVFIAGINAFGNVYANGVAILAANGSSTLTMTPGNNVVILGDNGTKAATISVKDAPTFTGNITGGNILTAGQISATGNITGGNVNTGNINLTGNVIGNIITGGIISATGNASAGNLSTSGQLSVTGNVAVGGVIRYDQAVNNAVGNGFNKTGGAVTANGRTGQVTSLADSLAKGAAGTFTINNNYITNAKDVVIVNIASGASINSYAVAVTGINSAGYCNVTVTNNGSGPLAEALVFNFAVIKVS